MKREFEKLKAFIKAWKSQWKFLRYQRHFRNKNPIL
jgi:hypothetical protein